MSGALQGLRNAYLENDLELNGHNFTQSGVVLNFSLLGNANLAAIGALTTGAGFPAALRSYIGAATSAQGAKADSAVQSVSVAGANGVSGSSSGGTTPALTIALGAITPSSVNGLTFVAAATGFTVAGGTTSKTLTVSNTLTLAGTDGSTLNIGAGGTLGSAALTAASAYATTAQGTKADNAGAVNGLLKSNGSASFSAVTDNSANWNTAYSERNQWDGGATGLVAATGRTSLGGTTVGQSIFTLTNPSAIRFLQINADNTVTAQSASPQRTALGLAVGINVQAYNSTLDAIAEINPSPDQVIYCNGVGTVALASFPATLRTFAATPSSANFAALLTDESGTGGGFVRSAGGALTALTGLGIRSTGAAFDLTLATSEVLTTGRTLNIVLGDAARTLTFTGNASISGTNTGDQTTVSGSSGTAPAGTLSGATLASGVTASSLTSFGNSPTFVTPLLGTPTSGTLTSCTGLPISTGVSGLGTGVATFLGTPSGANLASALTSALPVSKGGTGATTLTAHGVVIGNGTGAMAITGAGTAGQVLTSNGASADPTFQTPGGPGYLVYAALLAQSGTDAPVATILQNTLGGTVVWTYISTGNYTGTLTGAFPSGKVPTLFGLLDNAGAGQSYQVNRITNDAVQLSTVAGDSGTDGILTDKFIEIRVYP